MTAQHSTVTATEFLDYLSSLYQRKNVPCYPGESLSLVDHMLQCAHIATRESHSDLLIAAALLHDVGHLLPDDPNGMYSTDHVNQGATLLTGFFPPIIIQCVQHHVAAKRYLCTTEPEYLNGLSVACTGTLETQGGLMDIVESEQFKQHPFLEAVLLIRRIDDQAIQPAVDCPEFEFYRDMLEPIVVAHQRAGEKS